MAHLAVNERSVVGGLGVGLAQRCPALMSLTVWEGWAEVGVRRAEVGHRSLLKAGG